MNARWVFVSLFAHSSPCFMEFTWQWGREKINPFILHNSLTRVPELPWWLSDRETTCQCRRCGFSPWVAEIPWRRKWQPTPVPLPGKSHGQRSLAGYSPCSCKELDMTEHRCACAHTHTHTHTRLPTVTELWISSRHFAESRFTYINISSFYKYLSTFFWLRN